MNKYDSIYDRTRCPACSLRGHPLEDQPPRCEYCHAAYTNDRFKKDIAALFAAVVLAGLCLGSMFEAVMRDF